MSENPGPAQRSFGLTGAPPLRELIDAPLLQSMMDDFYEVTRIPMSLLDVQGRVLVEVGWQEACARFHRVNPETRAHCTESDLVLTRDIVPGETLVYRCKNGLYDAATPVMLKDTRVGTLFSGQFFFDDEAVDERVFRRQAIHYGFDEDAYLTAIRALPRLSRTTVEVGLRFLVKLASMISNSNYSTMELARAEAAAGEALREQRGLAETLAMERGILREVMENTDTQLAFLDSDFRFVAVNDAYCAGSHCSREELIGKCHHDLFPDADTQAIFTLVRDTREPAEYLERPFKFVNQLWRATTYWDWRLSPVLGSDGELRGFTLSARDVTRRVRQRGFNDAIDRLYREIHATFDFNRVLRRIMPDLAAAAGCEIAGVALLSPDGSMHIAEQVGLAPDSLRLIASDQITAEAETVIAAAGPTVVSAQGAGRLSEMLEQLGIASALVVPLKAGDSPMGVLGFGYGSGPGEFDDLTVGFVDRIASSLSLALVNARLFHETMHSSMLSGALAAINEVLLSAMTTQDVVARLVAAMSGITEADQCMVIMPDGDGYTAVHAPDRSGKPAERPDDSLWYPAFVLAAAERRPILVGDAHADHRAGRDFAAPGGTRAFQMLPLTTLGRVTHVLALGYAEPRVFDEDDISAADRMAAAMSAALSNARLYENQHQIADRLQEALLAMPDDVEGVEFAYAYHSASDVSRVGGDFYDIFTLGDDLVGITIGDVAGKGLDAAALTSLAKNGIRAHASESGKSVSQVLELTNNLVYRATDSEAFATALFAVLDCRSGAITYANAGHPAAAIIAADGSVTWLAPSGPLLGAFEHLPFGEHTVSLGEDDLLLLYTDGVTETRRAGELYGEERLGRFLASTPERDTTLLIEELIADILAFGGGRLSDDLALLAVKRSSTGGAA